MAPNTTRSIRGEEYEQQSRQLIQSYYINTLIASPNSPCDESGTVKIYPMLNQLKFQKIVTTLNS